MMRKTLCLGTSVAMLLAGLSIALAGGASKYTPGHEMQRYGSRNGPGASGYALGHQMQQKGMYNYAPQHRTR